MNITPYQRRTLRKLYKAWIIATVAQRVGDLSMGEAGTGEAWQAIYDAAQRFNLGSHWTDVDTPWPNGGTWVDASNALAEQLGFPPIQDKEWVYENQ